MEKVIISGGNGLIGKHLTAKLLERGYSVAVLSRSRKSSGEIPVIYWDPDKNEIDNEAIASADYIVHLAGANIGEKRWTRKRKQLIINSRVGSGNLIFESITRQNLRLKAFITASAVGYYGSVTSGNICTESDPPSNDFLGRTCQQWEGVADRFDEYGIRTVKVRSGVVLSAKGGILPKLSIPARFGKGIVSGNGYQYFPWIHIDDLCSIFLKAIEDKSMSGAFNAVTPDFITNYDFVTVLASVFRKHYLILKVPAPFIRLSLGEMSCIILEGSRISAEKLKLSGFRFRFPDLKGAFLNLFNAE